MQLLNQVALITGSSRGIGRGIAVEMARAGADVVVNYRDRAQEAQDVADEVRALGRRALVCQADVSQRPRIDEMVQRAREELGKVDICVANAAITVRKPFLDLTEQDVNRVLDVSLLGVFNVSQSCARRMVERGQGGAILIISSVHAFIPFAQSSIYNACKAGINAMGFTMAEELVKHRVRVNVIEPGWITTDRTPPEEKTPQLGRHLPWGRVGTVQEVARAAVFLCSPDADYINAATLRVDGGFWLPSRGSH